MLTVGVEFAGAKIVCNSHRTVFHQELCIRLYCYFRTKTDMSPQSTILGSLGGGSGWRGYLDTSGILADSGCGATVYLGAYELDMPLCVDVYSLI